jgi:hypothetical protein
MDFRLIFLWASGKGVVGGKDTARAPDSPEAPYALAWCQQNSICNDGGRVDTARGLGFRHLSQTFRCDRQARPANGPSSLEEWLPSDHALPCSANRTRSSQSPCSRGRGWGAASWTAALSSTGRNWCWSEFLPSSTAPCTVAQPRTLWAPPTRTPGSSCLVCQARLGTHRTTQGWAQLRAIYPGGRGSKGPSPLSVL